MSDRLCLEFPLRPGYLAQVVIPRDLTKEEAGRLSAFVMALAQSNVTGPGHSSSRGDYKLQALVDPTGAHSSALQRPAGGDGA